MVRDGSRSGWRKVGLWALPPLLVAGILLWGRFSGGWLVVEQPEKSDVIVVLAGGRTDQRYFRGLELLRSGYGRQMLLDVEDKVRYGESQSETAERFVRATAGDVQDRVHTCSVKELSTIGETEAVGACLEPLHPTRLLLVTNDFHTRRALSIFQNRLPQYHWGVTGVRDDYDFGVRWWRRRLWARTYLLEWMKLTWWCAVDRWTPRPVVSHGR